MIFNILIVDDEKLSRLYIRNLVLEFLPDAIVFEARNVAGASEIIREGNIDILFLDIQMPERNGFDLLASFRQKSFDTVFITAYSQYAIEAIKNGAVDYILKPINKREFKTMLERLILLRKEKMNYIRKDLAARAYNEVYLSSKIAVAHQNGIKFIPVSEILYLKAMNTYTIIHHINGSKTVASKAISRFEDQVDEQWFFRIHKSFIINLNHFLAYISTDGSFAEMSNGDKIPVSRHRLKSFMEVLHKTPTIIKP